MKQQKRHKLQLFYDILSAIEQDMYQNEGTSLAKPTHVQQYSRLSYDKMTDLFGDLKNKHMILRYESNGLLTITSKGRDIRETVSRFDKPHRRPWSAKVKWVVE